MTFGWNGDHELRYYIYLILASFRLRNTAAFVYGARFSVRIRGVTGKEKPEPHKGLGNTEKAERSDVADEKKEYDFNTKAQHLLRSSAGRNYFCCL